MALAIHFSPASMTREQYDEIVQRLDDAGAWPSQGHLHHTCYGGETLQVLDIFDSPENFEAFGRTLMPILQEVGVDPGRPEVQPVYKLVDD